MDLVHDKEPKHCIKPIRDVINNIAQLYELDEREGGKVGREGGKWKEGRKGGEGGRTVEGREEGGREGGSWKGGRYEARKGGREEARKEGEREDGRCT